MRLGLKLIADLARWRDLAGLPATEPSGRFRWCGWRITGLGEQVPASTRAQVVDILDRHLLIDCEHRIAVDAVAGDPNRVETELIQVVIPQAGRAGYSQLGVRAAMLGGLFVAMSLITSWANPAFRNLWLTAPCRVVFPIVQLIAGTAFPLLDDFASLSHGLSPSVRLPRRLA